MAYVLKASNAWCRASAHFHHSSINRRKVSTQ